MATISVTRLRLARRRLFPVFMFHALRSAFQVKRADGCLNMALRANGRIHYTMTAWRDPAALRAFMSSGHHRIAMPKLAGWCDEAAVVRFEHEGDQLPSWEAAEEMLETHGRTSKVDRPSPAHAAGSPLGEKGRASATAPSAL